MLCEFSQRVTGTSHGQSGSWKGLGDDQPSRWWLGRPDALLVPEVNLERLLLWPVQERPDKSCNQRAFEPGLLFLL